MSHAEEIIEIVAKQAKAEPSALTRDTKLADLNLQSIDIVELIFAVEDKFDIEVPYSPSEMDAAGVSFETVGSLVDAVEKLIGEQKAG